tara:strand:+ start:2457 stop:2621 length:165 start_codon:yes stop_codon:yes gene_type:complete
MLSITMEKCYPAACSAKWAHDFVRDCEDLSVAVLQNEAKRRVREVKAAEWYGVN